MMLTSADEEDIRARIDATARFARSIGEAQMPNDAMPDWSVLLIGGPSGVGKSTVAKQLARRFGVSWLQVDDLRLALQWSNVRLPDPDDTRNLYFFEATPDVWRLPAEQLRDGFVGVGQALTPAIAKVITNHAATAEPIVLEGDGLLPSVLARPDVREYGAGGRVRVVFVAPRDEEAVLANLFARGWGGPGRDEAELRTRARAIWLYSVWLAAEARQRAIPVIHSQPWASLADRIITSSASLADLHPDTAVR